MIESVDSWNDTSLKYLSSAKLASLRIKRAHFQSLLLPNASVEVCLRGKNHADTHCYAAQS